MDGSHADNQRPVPRADLWARGGAWVLAQFPLTALALFAARLGPTIPGAVVVPARWVGLGLFVGGGLLFLAGALDAGLRPDAVPEAAR